MRYEKSAGFVVYKEVDGKRLYLIIRQTNQDYGFPKGHIEDGESEFDAAIRELYEETGVCVEPIYGFRRELEYPLSKPIGSIKQVVYYLGKAISDDIKIQESELLEASFMTFADAMQILSFKSTQDVLGEAEEYIKSRNLH